MVTARAFITLENAISQIVQVFGFIRLGFMPRDGTALKAGRAAVSADACSANIPNKTRRAVESCLHIATPSQGRATFEIGSKRPESCRSCTTFVPRANTSAPALA